MRKAIGLGVSLAFLALVGAFGVAVVACASSSSSATSGGSTPAADGGAAAPCTVQAGGYPAADCEASRGECEVPATCTLASSCGNTNECLNTVDNTGKTKFALRVRRLNIASPPSLKDIIVQRTILNKAMDFANPACSERGDGSFNWIMQIDTATNRLITGGAAPADVTGNGSYCFVRTKLNGFDAAPIDVKLTKDAQGRYTTETVPVLNVPIFVLNKRDNVIILPLRGVTVHDVTVSPSGNCIGGFRIGGLDSALSCKEDDTSCSKWTTGAALGGFVSLADADKIDIVDIGKTLCTVLTSKTGADNKSCPKTAAGALDVQGDYCSTTNSVGGCRDSFWVSATLAASATSIDPNPTDAFCTPAAQ